MPNQVRPNDAHDDAEVLLPWYATGQLDRSDRAVVEKHLSSCANCQRQLNLERLLIEEYRSLTPGVDSGWARLRGQIDRVGDRRSKLAGPVRDLWNLLSRPAVATLALAQLVFVIVTGAILLSLNRPAYRALGEADASPVANIIVIFRADATEGDIRDTLRANGASLVGGPTSADAYLIHVPANERASALAKLQFDDDVQMAEPIDGVPR